MTSEELSQVLDRIMTRFTAQDKGGVTSQGTPSGMQPMALYARKRQGLTLSPLETDDRLGGGLLTSETNWQGRGPQAPIVLTAGESLVANLDAAGTVDFVADWLDTGAKSLPASNDGQITGTGDTELVATPSGQARAVGHIYFTNVGAAVRTLTVRKKKPSGAYRVIRVIQLDPNATVELQDAGWKSSDDFQYWRLVGRAGGQNPYGGTATGEKATIRGNTVDADGGAVNFRVIEFTDNTADPIAANRLNRNGNYLLHRPGSRVFQLPHFKNEEPSTDGALAQWDNTNKEWKQGGKAPIGDNLAINGDVRIDQANAGAAVTVNAASIFYGPDMWMAFGQSANTPGVFTIQQLSASPPDGFTHYLRAAVTSNDAAVDTNAVYAILHYIEGFNCQRLGWGTASAKAITISFRVRTSFAGPYSVTIMNNTSARQYRTTFTTLTTNWETVSVTIPGDTSGTWTCDNSSCLKISFSLGAGATATAAGGSWSGSVVTFGAATGQTQWITIGAATFDITGLKVETGSVATDFEVRDYGFQLRQCMRYLWCKITSTVDFFAAGGCISGTQAVLVFPLPVEMRQAPALSVSAASDFDLVDSIGAAVAVTAIVANGFNETYTAGYTVSVAAGLTAGRPINLASDGGASRKLLLDARLS